MDNEESNLNGQTPSKNNGQEKNGLGTAHEINQDVPNQENKKPVDSAERVKENESDSDSGTPDENQEDSQEEERVPIDPILERSIFQEAPHRVESILKEFKNNPKDHFQKIGFYTAIHPEAIPLEQAKEKLDLIILDQEIQVAKVRKRIRGHIDSQQEEIKKAKSELEIEVYKYEERLEEESDYEKDLREEKEAILYEIDEIKEELKLISARIGREREDIIEKRIRSLRKELDEIAETFDSLTEKKNSINRKEYEANKDIYKKRADRYRKFLERSNLRLERVENKLKNSLSVKGSTHQFLFFAGTSAAGAAGWFFSVYIVNKPVYISGFLSFFFTRLFSIGGTEMMPTGKTDLALKLLAMFIGVLVVTTILSWLGQTLLIKALDLGPSQKRKGMRRRGKEFKVGEEGEGLESDLSLSFGDESKNYYRAQVKAGSFLTFWLQALPVVFILGILFILLTVSGTGVKDVDKLMSSLSGHLVGTSITFGLAGLLYLYIKYVIDPRSEMPRSNDENSTYYFIRRNWELSLVFIVFILAMGALLIWPDQSYIAIFGFVAIALMAGMAIAYGVYFRGLLLQEKELKREIVDLSFAIDNSERPIPLYMHKEENQQFKHHYMMLMEQMYKLSAIRNNQAAELVTGKEMVVRPKVSGRVPKREYQFIKALQNLGNLFSNKKEEQEEKRENEFVLTKAEQTYFQQYSFSYSNLNSELKGKNDRLKQVREELEELAAGINSTQKLWQQCIKKLELSKKNLVEASERLERVWIDATTQLVQEREKRTVDLTEGFEVGLWYRANEITPTPNYNINPKSTH